MKEFWEVQKESMTPLVDFRMEQVVSVRTRWTKDQWKDSEDEDWWNQWDKGDTTERINYITRP